MAFYTSRFTLSWAVLANVRVNLFHAFRKLALEQECIDNLGLLLTEYLSNLLRHAKGEGQSVCFELHSESSHLRLRILDKTEFNTALASYTQQPKAQSQELKEGGMGLGLIAHLYPDFCYQQLDKVNCFEISIPLNKRPKARIMLVDDSRASLALLEQYLQEKYQVDTYTDPQQALTKLLKTPPDILILDMMMPTLSGDEFIQYVRHHEKLSHSKIVVYTGDTNCPAAIRANGMGIDAMLDKAATKAMVNQTVERMLGNHLRDNESRLIHGAEDALSIGDLHCYPRGAVNLNHSGDMLFTIPCDDGTLLILLDVMGHGAKAGALRSKLEGMFQGIVSAGNSAPAHIMAAFSNALYQGMFASQCVLPCLIIKINGEQLQWVSAGLPPIGFLSSDALSFASAQIQALPGLSAKQQYHAYSNSIDQTTRILLVTDGVYENIDRRWLRAENLQQHLQSCAHCQHNLRQKKNKQSDTSLINCLWSNSLSALSKEIDDASVILLS